MGADARTFMGLTGMGDLMATLQEPAVSQPARRRGAGARSTLERELEDMGSGREGVKTGRPVMELAEEHDVFMPIAAEVDAVVNEGRIPRDAYRGLGAAPPESEHHGVA